MFYEAIVSLLNILGDFYNIRETLPTILSNYVTTYITVTIHRTEGMIVSRKKFSCQKINSMYL